MTKAEAAKLNGKKGGRPRKATAEPAISARPAVVETYDETHPDHETHATHQTPADVLPAFENPYGLSTRELLFVEAYCGVAGGNASEAYRIAGYKGTAESVSANAARLKGSDRVARAIAARTALRVRKLIMDGDEALERISMFARADIRKLFPEGSALRNLPDDVAVCIKSVTPSKYGTRLELIDPLRANELMAKVAGRLKETVKVERSLEDILSEVNALERVQASA